MRIRNSLGMPDHAFKAICRLQGRTTAPELDYIGVTTLMGAPLSRFLRARYWDELEFDVADTMNAIQGQMGHLLFDKVESTTIKEVRLKVDFEGQRIFGIMDYYDPETCTLGDSKFKQVNSVTAERIKKDDALEKQLNIYAWMARKAGYEIKRLQGDIYINGWVRYKAFGEGSYPKAPYIKLEIPLWGDSFTEAYLRDRIKAHDTPAIRLLKSFGAANMLAIPHEEAQVLDGFMNKIPICTEQERWTAAPKYAVMKEGQKKAVRVFDQEYQAAELVRTLSKCRVEKRPGGDIKCLFYCDFRHGLCPYRKEEVPT